MRVLVYGLVGTNRGGIETFLLKMNQNMSENMVFDYVLEEKECIHSETIFSKGGEIYYVTNRVESPIKNIKENKALLKKLRKTHDAVYFNLSSLSWIEPIRIARSLGYRVFVHAHNAEFIAANNGIVHRLANAVNKKRLSRFDITRLTCSKPATDFLFGPNSGAIMIYNAIRPEQFAFDQEKRDEIRNGLGFINEKILGFVGRINDQKNPLYLPVIMRSVFSKRKDVKMLVVGEGPMRKQLEDMIDEYGLKDLFILTGNVTNVNELMQAMDVFVLPSWHEGLPYVVVEAQTSGLPCVISDRITREVDITGNVSFLSVDGSGDIWGDAICRVFDQYNSADREKWGAFVASTNFNIRNEARRLEGILSGSVSSD